MPREANKQRFPPPPSAQTKRAAKETKARKKDLPSSSETDPRKLGPPVFALRRGPKEKFFFFSAIPVEDARRGPLVFGAKAGARGALKTFRWRRICCPPLQRMQIPYPGGGAFATGKAALRYGMVAFQQSSFLGDRSGAFFQVLPSYNIERISQKDSIFC